MERETSSGHETGRGIGDLLHRIGDDIRVIAKDELELIKGDVSTSTKTAAFEGAVVILGGVVALIGLSMLCAAAVAALAPVIPSLALRLLLMAAVYIVVGGIVGAVFAKRLKKDAIPDTSVERYEAHRTLSGIKHTLTSQERPTHA